MRERGRPGRQSQTVTRASGQSPTVGCVRLGALPGWEQEEQDVEPSAGTIPWPGCSREGVQEWHTGGPTGLLHPPLILGTRSRSVFLLRLPLPLPGELAGLRWPVGWRRRGRGAWHFFTDSPCLFLGRLSPVPTPHLCKARDPAFSGTGEGKGPGQRDRWGPSPHKAAVRGPSMTHCPCRGEEAVGGGRCAGQQSALGASERWRPLCHEPSALQSCGNLISLKGLLSAKTWALCQALGVQFGKTALNLILKEGPLPSRISHNEEEQ